VATEATQALTAASAEADTQLVRRLQKADQAAYAEFCHRFGTPLHRYAASRLAGDQDLAEEIVVQTFVDAVRNIRRFNSRKGTLAAWLYGIARRQIARERRKQRQPTSVPSAAQVSLHSMAEVADVGDVADESAARLDAQRKIADLSQILSDDEMEMLMLHYAVGLSAKEIARTLGRSHRAVESMLHRTKAKAREWVGSDDE
jgi:RNA polymerase sigma-70 factor (ECF subfamily)